MKFHALFIGSFLSSSKGSLSVSEFVAQKLHEEGFNIELSSRKRNKFLRLLDIIYSIIITPAKIIQVEVYSGSAFKIAQVSVFFANFLKKRIIFNLHGGMLPEFYLKNEGLVLNTLKRADKIITPSHYLKGFFEPKGLQIEYLPNSVNLTHFPFNPPNFNLDYKILWVRSFSEIYNPWLAVKILKELKSKYPNITLNMVGPNDGLLDNTLELIKSLDLEESIKIAGPIPNSKLNEYYSSHHVYINTTSFESFGVSLVEAASCGIPMVSSAVGEIPNMWKDEFEILLVQQLDPALFANQIERLFLDGELRRKLISSANKKAIQYDWQNVKTIWHKLLN